MKKQPLKQRLVKYFPFALAFMFSCAGAGRCWSNCTAKNLGADWVVVGADWVVVELREADGTPYRCWELKDVSITNEQNSDGIYWKDSNTGNLIHVSGSYDYIQVTNGNWDAAFAFFGLTAKTCRMIRTSMYNPKTQRYELKK